MRASIIYTLQRAVIFVAPFAILMIAQVPWYLSLVIALVFAFCASYIFLRGSRDRAIAELQQARARKQGTDEDVEDAARDADEAPGAEAPTAATAEADADEAEATEDAPADDRDSDDSPADDAR